MAIHPIQAREVDARHQVHLPDMNEIGISYESKGTFYLYVMCSVGCMA